MRRMSSSVSSESSRRARVGEAGPLLQRNASSLPSQFFPSLEENNFAASGGALQPFDERLSESEIGQRVFDRGRMRPKCRIGDCIIQQAHNRRVIGEEFQQGVVGGGALVLPIAEQLEARLLQQKSR